MKHLPLLALASIMAFICGCGIIKPGNEPVATTPTTIERSTLTILVNPGEPFARNRKTNEFVTFLDAGATGGTSVEQVLAIDRSFRTMTELEQEWYENPQKAKLKYQGKRVRLVGLPHGVVHSDQDSKVLLTLDYNYNQWVLCEFADTERLDEVNYKSLRHYIVIEGTWSGDFLGRYINCKVLQLEVRDLTEIPNP